MGSNDKRIIMSDDEYEKLSNTSQTSMKGDEAFAKRKQGMQKNELNEQLKDYINQWRDERTKEEAELKRLKDKQAKRKEIRAEQEKALAMKKREEDGRSRNQETRNDGSPERKGWQVFSPCYGCSQGAIQVQRTSWGGMQNLLEHPYKTHSP